MRILVSNDDGYLSPGLYLLAESAKEFGEVIISSTEVPRSASGREITFSRPLRYMSKEHNGWKVFVTDGTPIDALHLAVEVLSYKPDLVLSGVNVGDNLSLQHIFYSGTLAVTIEASLMGIPSVAFSADVSSFKDFLSPQFKHVVNEVVRFIINYIQEKGFPSGVDLFSVNIPVNFRNCFKVVKASRLRWKAAFKVGIDPRGRKYYWLYGVRGGTMADTDVYAFEQGCIILTPLSIDLNVKNEVIESLRKDLGKLKISVDEKLKSIGSGDKCIDV